MRPKQKSGAIGKIDRYFLANPFTFKSMQEITGVGVCARQIKSRLAAWSATSPYIIGTVG
jgi:hypothetical protein